MSLSLSRLHPASCFEVLAQPPITLPPMSFVRAAPAVAGTSATTSARPVSFRQRRVFCRAESQPHHDSVGSLNVERTLFGENLGARDAFEGELVTGFGAKSLGNADTLHVVKPPSGMAQFIGLAAMEVSPENGRDALSEEECLLKKCRVPGWRVAVEGDVLMLQQEFKAKDAESAKAALGRFQVMAESVGHPIAKAALTDTSVILGLSTKEAQGVSLNDFILAARLNTVSLKDLQPARKRPVWA